MKRQLIDHSWRFRVETYAKVMSGGDWIPFDWLVYALQKAQGAISEGGARLLVNAPPRHGKSEGFSHWLPAWFLDWFPEKRVILSSYSDRYAAKWGLKVRDEFQLNPETWTRIRSDKSIATDWETTKGGGMRSVGVGGSITGFGGDLILIDDPHKNWEEAMSPTLRQKTIDFFNSTLYTRAEPGASIIVIQTRWHEEDLTGYLMSMTDEKWERLSFPALAEGKDLLNREEGKALCPERFDEKALNKIKNSPRMGSYIFSGLYQQRPAPIEGGQVKRHWFKRFSEMPERFDELLQSWDLSFKETGSSFVVGQTWGRIGANYYIVDRFRAKVDFPTTLKKIKAMTARWPLAIEKLVEDKANGPAVIATLNDSVPGIIPVNPRGSKEARLAAVSGVIESGNVYVPDSKLADWGGEFIEEVVTFPYAANDDQVDAMTQALDRFIRSGFTLNLQIPSTGQRPNPWEDIYARPQ